MEYQNFVTLIHQNLSTFLDAELCTNIHKALKNNGKERIGITISQEHTNISPTIYLEEFHSQYENGRSLDDILENIVSLYHEVKFEHSWEIDQIHNFQRAKSKILYKLVHREKNTELLNEIPFVPYLDFAIVFYLLLETTERGSATILITNELLQYWKASLNDLYSIACQNTPQIMSAEFKPMKTLIHELMGNVCPADEIVENRMFVLSNNLRHFGAACILYNRVLEDIGNQLNEDFYILPSSIHEVIILPISFKPESIELNEMIKEINKTQVSEEEVLSDHAYYYSRKEYRLLSV